MPKKKPKYLASFARGMSLLNWFSMMCVKDLRWGGSKRETRAATREELLDDREIPWLPMDRGLKPTPELDGLIRTGHVERSNPIPALLRVQRGLVTYWEAARLTRKGREALAEVERLQAVDNHAALEVLITMCDFSEEDTKALREHAQTNWPGGTPKSE